jgi:CrcB protein
MGPRRRELLDLSLVAAGAIPGALLRWQLPNLLLANLLGCLLLGLLLGWPGPRPRLMLWGGIGFCGSLTSFSSWMLQLAALPLASAAFWWALLVPLLGGFAAFFAGAALAGGLVREIGRGNGSRLRR